jgi:hypothetical protein
MVATSWAIVGATGRDVVNFSIDTNVNRQIGISAVILGQFFFSKDELFVVGLTFL